MDLYTIRRTIKRADRGSEARTPLSEILDVLEKYLRYGIVHGEIEQDGKAMRYIKDIHRKSTIDKLKYPSTEQYERECFEKLPLEIQKALIVYIRELTTIV